MTFESERAAIAHERAAQSLENLGCTTLLMQVANVTSLSAEELVTRVRSLDAQGNRLLAELLVHLGEVDRRALYKEHACSSMFAFCRKLGMSEGSAARRIDAARAIRKFPGLLPRIAKGKLHLTALSIVCSILTPENVESVIAAVVGKSRIEVEELKVRYAPKPEVRDSIRKMPEPARRPEPRAIEAVAPPQVAVNAASNVTLDLGAQTSLLAPPPAAVTAQTSLLAPPPVAVAVAPIAVFEVSSPAPAPEPARVTLPTAAPLRAVTPLREDAYKVQLMANKAIVTKITHAKEMMRHRNPTGDLATIVDAALDLLIAKLEKERFGRTERPRKVGPTKTTPEKKKSCKPGYVDIETRRQLFERDGYQCTYVDAHGHRCCERGWLEIDHVEPKALGGGDELTNLRIRCRAHNMMYAKEVFGADYVERRIRESRDVPREGGAMGTNAIEVIAFPPTPTSE